MPPQPNLRTQLFKAARNGDPRLLAELIHRGAPPDCRDSKGFTPLGLVCFLGRAEAARVLLANGASPELGLTWDLDNPLIDDSFSDYYRDAAGQLSAAGGKAPKAGPLDFTPLMLAALGKAPQVVPVLLDGRANLEAAGPFGWTAVMLAITRADPHLLRTLLQHGASLQAIDFEGRRALDKAFDSGDHKILEVALEFGAQPSPVQLAKPNLQALALLHPQSRLAQLYRFSEPDAPAPTPAALSAAMSKAILNEDAQAVRRLVQLGADPRALTEEGLTPLLLAVEDGRTDLAPLLLDLGADPSELEVPPLPPLLAAVLWGTLADLEALLLAGTPVNQATPDGRTALLLAVGKGNLPAVRLLLEQGADPNLCAVFCGRTRLMASEALAFDSPLNLLALPKAFSRVPADIHGRRRRYRNSLAEAVAQESLEMVQLLLAGGADPNLAPSPLLGLAILIALDRGLADILDLLLASGARLDPQTVALDLEVGPDSFRLLTRLGANLHATDATGKTLLMKAVHGFGQGVQVLLTAGMDPNATDRQGLTALDHALMSYLEGCFDELNSRRHPPKALVTAYLP